MQWKITIANYIAKCSIKMDYHQINKLKRFVEQKNQIKRDTGRHTLINNKNVNELYG